MARVTIEDCLNNVDNSYQLVNIAARRARQIFEGGKPLVVTEGEKQEKAAVIALREIAENHINSATDFSSLDAQYAEEARIAAQEAQEKMREDAAENVDSTTEGSA